MTSLPSGREPLSDPEGVFETILSGSVDDAEIARFLIELSDRGETVDEIVGAASALRCHMIAVSAPEGAVDVCGTGGDGAHTRNISTAVAILVAAAGVPVAKHGNRAASSKSGAADVLSALGLNLDLPPARVEASVCEIGIGFLFAARHHPVMARVAPVRRALRRRTIFNLLGPLANPANVSRQLVGVFDEALTAPMAQALGRLGGDRAWVVHGEGSLDELSVLGSSKVSALEAGKVRTHDVHPADAGLSTFAAVDIRGGTPEENAAALERLLDGEPGGYRDIVLMNAGAALVVAGRGETLADGVRLAQSALDSGEARDKLDQWRRFA
ncbi:anthranilate phosphoribosyltransferase [Pacificimonas flava]|uniref:Anthranilate phosphoribosyltransferase n=2 Tax=Pacificimonas TaxID=1960290 RepID=A0A219B7M2_9SPHN|nr:MULTISPECIES: anthranilate phosphoribosyltransferase [Pacificimonas]MBZ6378618.1 anthranilate phosphoribosyltransferase [Pacificimonas aurantium]OWV34106.1 anthranilate phosphoribosyltransferase [Pacificimonas flava]